MILYNVYSLKQVFLYNIEAFLLTNCCRKTWLIVVVAVLTCFLRQNDKKYKQIYCYCLMHIGQGRYICMAVQHLQSQIVIAKRQVIAIVAVLTLSLWYEIESILCDILWCLWAKANSSVWLWGIYTSKLLSQKCKQ